ncbi:MAG: SH3 domain-containing protein [Devosia sp.]
MKKTHEKLLLAALAGLVIASAAAFVAQPALAAGYQVDGPAIVTGLEDWDTLNVRLWPASYSQKVGEISPETTVWVERCISFEDTSDWCLVEQGDQQGWVNATFLEQLYDWDI